MVVFAATGLILVYCASIPVNFALIVRLNGHTAFGAGLSVFEGRYALRSARMRACGEKKHWMRKRTGMDLEKKGLFAAVLHAVFHLLRHARIEQLRLEGRLCLSDAAGTAMMVGGLQALSGAVSPAVPGRVHVSLQPDFSCGKSDALLSGMICVRAGHIMLAALKGAWHYLKATRRTSAHGKASD